MTGFILLAAGISAVAVGYDLGGYLGAGAIATGGAAVFLSALMAAIPDLNNPSDWE